MVSQVQSMCGECRGQGERINPKDRCKTCEGRKVGVLNLSSVRTLLIENNSCNNREIRDRKGLKTNVHNTRLILSMCEILEK